jgi:hypothetical protein
MKLLLFSLTVEKNDLKTCLRLELDHWSAKSYEALVDELRDVVAYSVGEEPRCYQVEVVELERTTDYIHVSVSVDGGGWRAFVPLSTSFIVHADGSVDKPNG